MKCARKRADVERHSMAVRWERGKPQPGIDNFPAGQQKARKLRAGPDTPARGAYLRGGLHEVNCAICRGGARGLKPLPAAGPQHNALVNM